MVWRLRQAVELKYRVMNMSTKVSYFTSIKCSIISKQMPRFLVFFDRSFWSAVYCRMNWMNCILVSMQD